MQAVPAGSWIDGSTALRAARRAHPIPLALIDGLAGAVVSVGGRPMAAFGFVVRDGRVWGIEVLADPETLAALELESVRGETQLPPR